MCTAVTYKTDDLYFGRTLDFDYSYGEGTVIIPRNFPLKFRRCTDGIKYAIMGTALVSDGFPLLFDAVNECGLCAAGLRFEGNAYYRDYYKGACNIAQFEFIPWILGICNSVKEARAILPNINITNEAFSESLPPSPLHWIIADKYETITVESVKDGIKVYDNPVGVLANNPPFEGQILNLCNYMFLSPKQPKNRFGEALKAQSRGMGTFGLPGDLSSQSRFVRAAFARRFSYSAQSEDESVCQLFRILDFVSQPLGCCEIESGGLEYTVYTSCYNADRGIYYLKTYYGKRITAVDMHKCDLDGQNLTVFPHISGDVEFLN